MASFIVGSLAKLVAWRRYRCGSLTYLDRARIRQEPTEQRSRCFFRKRSPKPLTIFGDDTQTRDFISVKDVVAALEFAATTGLTGVFNVGYGREITILELAQRILALTDSRSAIQFAPARIGDVQHSLASVERLRKAGFYPTGTLNSGLSEMLAAIR